MPPIKPGRWAVSLAEIDPQYLGLWRDLILAVPLWEGSGVPYDIITSKGADIGSALTWAVGEGGMGVDTRSVANRMAWDGVHNFATNEAASIFVYASFADNTATKLTLGADDFGSYIGLVVDALGVDDWLYGGNDDSVAWDGDGLTQRVTASYDGDRVLIVSNGKVHTDTTGVSRTTDSDAVVLSSAQTDQTSAVGLFYVLYVWKRGLTLQEARLLDADPFGPIRPHLEPPAVSGAGSASPGVIARSFTVEDVTLVGPAVDLQAVINRSFALGATTQVGPAVDVQSVINRLFALDQVTPVNSDGVSGTATPDVIALTFTIPSAAGFVVLVHVSGSVVVVLDGSTGDAGLAPSLASVDLDPTTAWSGLDRSSAKG